MQSVQMYSLLYCRYFSVALFFASVDVCTGLETTWGEEKQCGVDGRVTGGQPEHLCGLACAEKPLKKGQKRRNFCIELGVLHFRDAL